jgi:hypothetical protein
MTTGGSTMYVRTALIAALLSMATLSHAGTEHDHWVARLKKYAVYIGTPKAATIVDAFPYAKAACICNESGSLNHRPGYVVVGEGADGLIAYCAVPSFDENGALELAAGCASFVLLAK